MNNKIKRLTIIILSLCMVIAVVPAIMYGTAPKAKAIVASDWETVKNGLASGYTVTLSSDITADSANVEVGNGAVLDLAGFNISYTTGDKQNGEHWSGRGTSVQNWIFGKAEGLFTDNYTLFIVPSNRTFTITDTGSNGKIYFKSYATTGGDNYNDYATNAQIVRVKGTLNINGGIIETYAEEDVTENGPHCASAVSVPVVNDGGTVNVYGGSIIAGSRADGAPNKGSSTNYRQRAYSDSIAVGIYTNDSGTVNMYGGFISISAKCDQEDSSSGISQKWGDYRSSFIAYGVGVDMAGSGAFNMYGGSIDTKTFCYDDGASGSYDGTHCYVANGVNYTGNDNYPKLVGGQITTGYLEGKSNICEGKSTYVGYRAAVGKITLSMSAERQTSDANTATFTPTATTYWKNEFGKSYSHSVTTGQNPNGFESLYGGMTDGAKVRLVYRIYNSDGGFLGSYEYYDSTVSKVLSGVPTLTGVTKTGSFTSSSAGGELKYSGACGTTTNSFTNSCYADSSTTTVTYLKQAASASYPDLSTAGTSTGTATLANTEMMYIFVNVTLKKTASVNLTLQGNTVQYQGQAIEPGILSGTTIGNDKDGKTGDFGISIAPQYASDNRSDITTDLFKWNSSLTGKKQDVIYSYQKEGTSTWIDGLPSDPGTYTIKAKLEDSSPDWSNYPASTGANINDKNNTCEIVINKRTPTITANNMTLTYGTNISAVYGCGSTKPSNVTFTEGTKTLRNPAGEYHFYDSDENLVDTSYLEAGTYSLKLVWTPTASWSPYYNEKTVTNITLTVEKAPLSIAARNRTMTYGDSKTFEYTDFEWTGLVNGDTAANLFNQISGTIKVGSQTCDTNKTLTVESSRDNIVADSPYSWGFVSPTLANYTITATNGSMTVNKRTIYASAIATTKEYNASAVFNITFAQPDDSVAQQDSITVVSTTGLADKAAVGTNHIIQIYLPGTTTKITTNWNDLMSGAKKDNYTLIVDNNPNDYPNNIEAKVTKTIPTYTIPTLAAVTYDSEKNVVDQFCAGSENFIGNSSGTSGHFEWVDTTRIPVVSDTTIPAKFVPDNTDNYETVNVDIPVTVNKRVITVAVSCDEISYGDAAPALTYVFSNFTGDEKLTGNPTVEGGFVSSGITVTGGLRAEHAYSAGSDSGEYSITITSTLVADNYEFTALDTSVIKVNKLEVTVTANNKSIEYGKAAPSFTVSWTGFIGDDSQTTLGLSVSCTTNYAPSRAAGSVGTYDIIPNVYGLTATNYTFKAANGVLTVTPATLYVVPDDLTIGYGTALTGANKLTCSYEGLTAGDTVANIVRTGAEALVAQGYSVDADTETYSPAGTYTIVVDNDDWISCSNYVIDISRTATLTVEQAPTSIVLNTLSATISFGDSLADADFSGTIIAVSHGDHMDGTFRFNDASTIPQWQDRIPEAEGEAGNSTVYKATFTPTDSNCKPVEFDMQIHINARAIEGEPVISGSIMNGAMVSADVSGMNPAVIGRYDVEWIIDTNVVSTDTDFEITSSMIGKYLTLRVTAKSIYPYEGYAQVTSTYKISDTLPVATSDMFTVSWTNRTYDGTPAVATAVNNGIMGVGSATVRYNNSTTAPTNAGTYRITLDIAQGTSYAPVSGVYYGDLVISPASVYVSFGVLDKEYNAKTNATIDKSVTITKTGVIGDDQIDISFDNATISFADANVGTDKPVTVSGLIITGAQKKNYTVVVDDTVCADITPKTLTTKARTTARTYDPDDYTASVTFTSLSGVLSADKGDVSIGSYEATVTNNGAGTREITDISVVLTGDKASNYVLDVANEADLTVIINKADATAYPGFEIPTGLNGGEYNAKTVSTVALPTGWTWNNGAQALTVSNTGYAATFTPADSDNYKTYVTTLPVTVSKRTLTVSYESYSITYGDSVPACSYSVSGYANGENFATFGGAIVTTCTYIKNANVGTYTVTNSASSTLYNPNYDIAYVPGTITVSAKTISFSGSASDRTYRAGNTSVDLSFTLDNTAKVRSNDDVYLSFAYGTGNVASADAGNSKAVTYVSPVLAGSSAGNYVLVNKTPDITVKISKATPSGYSFPSAATLEYGQPLSAAVFTTPGTGDGTFAFVDDGEYPAATGVYPNLYEVTYTPTDTNYSTVTRRVTLTVTKAKLTPYVTLSGSMYVGETIVANVSGLSGNAKNYIHYTWYKVMTGGAAVEIGDDMSSYELTSDDVDCTIKVEISLDTSAPYYMDETSAGLSSTTSAAVKEENLTFAQKIWKWWNSILTAIRRLLGITSK